MVLIVPTVGASPYDVPKPAIVLHYGIVVVDDVLEEVEVELEVDDEVVVLVVDEEVDVVVLVELEVELLDVVDVVDVLLVQVKADSCIKNSGILSAFLRYYYCCSTNGTSPV